MTKKEMNELADLIVDKLLTTYIREQATWYTSSTMDDIYHQFKQTPKKRTKKKMTESDLLGELAKLLTKLDYHKEKEEYEICAEIQKEIDIVNEKLSKL
jgi:TPP-dependent pyruvate/acetoin dehydrogenase alpha subunit